ncbi:MAG: hypothetical protein NTU93_02720 [Arthrobacter sp.]|nr:hypothetical protein [Arthrobacter sp.]
MIRKITFTRLGLKRKVITALTSLAMIFLGTVVMAPPADAAAGGYFCFSYYNGYAYYNQPVYIEVSADKVNWTSILTMQSDTKGCGGFILSGNAVNMYVRAEASQSMVGPLRTGVSAVWTGVSPNIGNPGVGVANLGWGVVVCTTRTVYACQS